MINANDAVQAKMNELRSAFALQLPEQIRQIVDAAGDLQRDGWNSGQAEKLAQLLHALAGTSGTFGFSVIRSAVQSLETELRSVIKEGRPPDSSTANRIGAFLAALQDSGKEAGTRSSAMQLPSAPPAPSASPDTTGRDTIYFVDDDPLMAESLALQIRAYGHRIVTFNTLAGFKDAMKTATPLLIIMDMSFPEGGLAGAEMVAQIEQGRGTHIPVVFLSVRSDFDARLEAVRSGGDAYFTKPVDVGKLVDRIDVITGKRPRDPYRILIVDDEPLLADYHATILRQAGMTTATVTDPLQVLRYLADFQPELVLMDIYMPSCNGMELAGVIRQDETYIDIPIVFLSAEKDLNRQLVAMSRGGDDFLTKPIHPEHLITSVTLRADRNRVLRSLMLYDGLTGLLNHTRTKELVDIEVSRVSRIKTQLTFAMIDIDHFKSVNDTHGHPAGDKVIKSLSHLLKQRLRATDTVGRFGGEEFAVILTDTDGPTAERILDELRVDFAKILQRGQEAVFPCTFSCGVACNMPGYTGSDLINAADKALYEAKRSGRNRVVLAQQSGEE